MVSYSSREVIRIVAADDIVLEQQNEPMRNVGPGLQSEREEKVQHWMVLVGW